MDGQNAQLFDFYQVNYHLIVKYICLCLIDTDIIVMIIVILIQLTNDYPTILTGDNIWIIGIAQEPSTRDYYLVFYYDLNAILSRYIRITSTRIMQYNDFYEIEEIGSGGYGTVYTAKHKIDEYPIKYEERVVLKRFKNIDKNAELFINEVSIHV